jgi:hypothetical protein
MSSILFTKPDSPEALEILRDLVQKINLPILGLIIKVNDHDEVVNVELSDEHTVKALALASALEEMEMEDQG